MMEWIAIGFLIGILSVYGLLFAVAFVSSRAEGVSEQHEAALDDELKMRRLTK